MKTIAILIPVIRPEKAELAIKLARINSGIDEERIKIKTFEDKELEGCPKILKKLTDLSSEDYICFLGDDTLPQKDWLKNALEDMETLPDGWGLFGPNDLTDRDLATHWVADRRLLPILGGEFFHTGYHHSCCDVELQLRCTEIGRYIYSKKAIVIHDHPFFTQEPLDEHYQRAYLYQQEDQKLLEQRRANGWTRDC